LASRVELIYTRMCASRIRRATRMALTREETSPPLSCYTNASVAISRAILHGHPVIGRSSLLTRPSVLSLRRARGALDPVRRFLRRTITFLGDRLSNGSPYATEPLSVLSVTMVYCGQTVGWIRMKLGIEVGFGPGHAVSDGTQLPSQKKETEPPFFGPCLL